MPILGSLGGLSARAFGFASFPKPVVTGGTLTSDATYYYRTFNVGTGTLGISKNSLLCDIVVQAGGGYSKANGSWFSGAGGGGTVWIAQKTLDINSYSVVVGAGATSTTASGDSTFGSGFTVAKGGGNAGGNAGGNGGGAGGYAGTTGGASTQAAGTVGTGIGYGNAGGNQNGNAATNAYPGGGGSGGGGGSSYADLGGASIGGNGGAAITLMGMEFGGGGGGFGNQGPGSQGTNGGGYGAGGTGSSIYVEGNGGNGIVIVRYLKSAV
jgi:hypothetical protein